MACILIVFCRSEEKVLFTKFEYIALRRVKDHVIRIVTSWRTHNKKILSPLGGVKPGNLGSGQVSNTSCAAKDKRNFGTEFHSFVYEVFIVYFSAS